MGTFIYRWPYSGKRGWHGSGTTGAIPGKKFQRGIRSRGASSLVYRPPRHFVKRSFGRSGREPIGIFQRNSCSSNDSAQRIFRNMDVQLGLHRQALVEPAQQSAASGEVQPGTVNIGSQFRRRRFKRFQNSVFDFGNRLINAWAISR